MKTRRCTTALLIPLTALLPLGGCPQENPLANGLMAAAGEYDLTGQKLFPNQNDPSEADSDAEESAPSEPDAAAPAPSGPPAANDGPVPLDDRGAPELAVMLPASAPYGTWLLESGGALPTLVGGLATFGVTTDVTALILRQDGTGRVFLRDRLTGARDCVRTFVIFDGDTLVLDLAAETATDFVFNIALDEVSFFFPVVFTRPNLMGIADEEGQIAIFSRQSELPPDVTCGELQVVDRFEGLPLPQFFSDLVLFNGDLVYSSSTQIESFDLETHTLGAPLGALNNRLVQTTQGGFLWTHCGCGGSRDAFKRTLLIVADTVSSESEMGGPITFRAMAYDPAADRLWLHGRSFDDQFGRFYVMNTNGEPDVIERQMSFNRDLRALAFGGPDLWGIVTVASQSVVRIDPATGQVLESFEAPDEDVSWSGLVFDAFNMYLLGADPAGEGVIYKLARP